MFGALLCWPVMTFGDTRYPVANPCLGSAVVVDTTSLDAIVNHPDRVLADPEGFWAGDAAYVLVKRWHTALAHVEIPWDEWRAKVERFAAMTDEERAADPSVELASEVAAARDSWSSRSVPLICSFLPDTRAPLDTTIYLSAALKPYAFMTQGKIVVDATSPRFQDNLDTILDLITHEVFHIGYGWRRHARRELELENPTLYHMLDSLQNEGMATYLGWQALEVFPEAVQEDYSMLDDPSEVRRLTTALNDLFATASAMAPDDLRSASWEVGVTGRAYYVVGAHMARSIDAELGRPALVRTVVEGPRSFVAAYNRIAPAGLQVVELTGPATEPPVHRLKLAAFDHDRQAFDTALADIRRDPDANGPDLERALNSLGYFLLGDDRVFDATSVFQLAVDLFPASANAHDSLGEAHMKAGDTAAAISSYERSLAIDPSNANAAAMLEKLRSQASNRPSWTVSDPPARTFS
jgi:tetratricopeptide (TPR) repeat protein